MAKLGRHNHLTVVRHGDKGVFLDGGRFGEVLLPRRFTDPSMLPGTEAEVFLYNDSEDRVVATTQKPKAMVGECAYLKVISRNRVGAFLDWGLPKDLLVPHSEQQKPMQQGYSYTVFVYVDEASQRIVASSKLERHLTDSANELEPRQPVGLLIYGKSDLGFKAVVDHRYLGQLYANETFTRLHYGERVQGYVKQVRKDGKIDLTLQLPSLLEREDLCDRILEHLRRHDGLSPLTDKSPPDDIYRVYGVSKANYKKALGQLYRQRAINIETDQIRLLP